MSFSEVVKKCTLFLDIPDREIDYLLEEANVIETHESDTVIFKEKDNVEGLYVVLDGKLSVEKKVNEKIMQIQVLYGMDFFGEQCITSDNQFHYDIISKSSCHVLIISLEKIEKYKTKYVKGYCQMLENIFRHEFARHRSTLGTIARLTFQEGVFVRFPLFDNRREKFTDEKRSRHKIIEELKNENNE